MAIQLHEIEDSETLPEQDDLIPGRERDEFQQQIDGMVAEQKHSTAAARWPTEKTGEDARKTVARDNTLYRRLVVSTEDATPLKKVVRRAAALHHTEPVFYKNGKTEKGHTVVKWHLARTQKDGKPVADATLNDDGTPKGKITSDGKLAGAARK